MTPKFYKNLARILQNTFWIGFMDVVQEELLNLKSEMSKKHDVYNARKLEKIEELRRINKSFGTFVDLTLWEDAPEEEILEYMRQETEGLVFKVKYKGSYEYYKHVFNRVYEKGETYLCFVDDSNIIHKGVDYEETLKNFSDHDVTTPFTQVPNVFPTFDQKVERYTLDAPETANYDTGWRFDPRLVGQTLNITKHMISEFIADDLKTKTDASGAEMYLLTPEYFRYLQRSINNKVQRKSTTIPHTGVQLTLYTDLSGNVFNINKLESSCYITPEFNNDYAFIQAGNSTEGYFYEREISFNEIYASNPNYNLVNVWIPAHKIYPETIAQGDGVATEYDSDDSSLTNGTITYTSIIKKYFRLYWTHNGVDYMGYDDGEGRITSDNDEVTGIIDYDTGEYELTFYRDDDSSSFAPDSGTNINVRYYTSQRLQINQARLLNESRQSVVESTFAPVEFYDYHDHLSIHYIIEGAS